MIIYKDRSFHTLVCRCVLGAVAVPCGQKDLKRKRFEMEQNIVYRNITYRLYPGITVPRRLLHTLSTCPSAQGKSEDQDQWCSYKCVQKREFQCRPEVHIADFPMETVHEFPDRRHRPGAAGHLPQSVDLDRIPKIPPADELPDADGISFLVEHRLRHHPLHFPLLAAKERNLGDNLGQLGLHMGLMQGKIHDADEWQGRRESEPRTLVSATLSSTRSHSRKGWSSCNFMATSLNSRREITAASSAGPVSLIFDTFKFEVEFYQGVTSTVLVSGTTLSSSSVARRPRRLPRFRHCPASSRCVRLYRPGEWFAAAGHRRSGGLRRRCLL